MENIGRDDLKVILGRNIQYYRRQIPGLTQEKLAEKVECSVSNIGKIECGNSLPSVEQLIRIANELNIGIDRLVSDVLLNKTDLYMQMINERLNDLPLKKRNQALHLLSVILEVIDSDDIQ